MIGKVSLILVFVFSVLYAADDKEQKQAAKDKAEFFKIEVEQIAELLTMEEFDIAQKHLDIIKKELSEKKNFIHYYQANIDFGKKDYSKAIEQFQALLKLKLSDNEVENARRKLFRSYLLNKQTKDATTMLLEFNFDGKKDSWYSEACLSLVQTISAMLVRQDPQLKVTNKEQVVKILKRFVKNFPKHKKAPWFQYHIAEYELNRLELMLKKINLAKDDGSPLVRKKKFEMVRSQLFDTRDVYEGLIEKNEGTTLAERSLERTKQLNTFLTKLNAMEDGK